MRLCGGRGTVAGLGREAMASVYMRKKTSPLPPLSPTIAPFHHLARNRVEDADGTA